jgi:mannosyltransferase
MKIYFDNIAFAMQKAGGLSIAWAELLKRIPSHYIAGYIEYGKQDNIFRNEICVPEKKIINHRKVNIKLQNMIDVAIKENEMFIFHSDTYRICRSKMALNVITVHDFVDEYFNKNIFKWTIKHIRKRHCILRADAIICASENTKRDLIQFFPNVDKSRIHIVYRGKSEEYIRDDSCLDAQFKEIDPQGYVLFVGNNRKGYKNFDTLVKAMAQFEEKKLVIVGGVALSRKEKAVLDNVIGKCRYFHYQNLDKIKLNLLYNNAYCLVYPSLYEGFGITVIEAQSAYCPVIAANASSLPEVLGDTAILLDLVTPKAIQESLINLKNPDIRNSLILKGSINARKYSWDRMAREYLDIYALIWRTKLEKKQENGI